MMRKTNYFVILLLLSTIFLPNYSHSEIPLAPYNVKVFCRQGRRFYRPSQTARECPSAATSCGYFQFPSPNKSIPDDSIGVYECVDNGILSVEDPDDTFNETYFEQLCGAIPHCTRMHINTLNKAFLKYLITQHELDIEGMAEPYVRFCCSLFHTTLQKLVQSGKNELSMPSPPPVVCFGQTCAAGAVGCLLHTVTSAEDYEYDDKKKRRKRQYIDDEDYVDAVELNFEDYNNEFELVTREPITVTTPPRTKLRSGNKPTKVPPRKIYPSGVAWTQPVTIKPASSETLGAKSTLPSLKLPFYLPDSIEGKDSNDNAKEELEETSENPPIEVVSADPGVAQSIDADENESNDLYVDIPLNGAETSTTTPSTTSTPLIVVLPTDRSSSLEAEQGSSPKPTFWMKTGKSAEQDEQAGEEDEEFEQEEHCVYRHLNDELYRYCLLVHQRKTGDRCYHHQGHIICCCFVPPDKETCDPTEMDLVLPPPVNRRPATTPYEQVTTTPTPMTSEPLITTEEVIESTTQDPITVTEGPEELLSSTTEEAIEETTTTTESPTTTSEAKKQPKRCRVEYIRPNAHSKAKPVLICDDSPQLLQSSLTHIAFAAIISLFFFFNLI